MSVNAADEKLAIDEYKLILDLWKSESPIKTNKLQVLLATNSILVTAFPSLAAPFG